MAFRATENFNLANQPLPNCSLNNQAAYYASSITCSARTTSAQGSFESTCRIFPFSQSYNWTLRLRGKFKDLASKGVELKDVFLQ